MNIVITGEQPGMERHEIVQAIIAKGHAVVDSATAADAILWGLYAGSKLTRARRRGLLEYMNPGEIPPAARKLNLGARYEIRMIREGKCVVTTGPRGSLLKAIKAIRNVIKGVN